MSSKAGLELQRHQAVWSDSSHVPRQESRQGNTSISPTRSIQPGRFWLPESHPRNHARPHKKAQPSRIMIVPASQAEMAAQLLARAGEMAATRMRGLKTEPPYPDGTPENPVVLTSDSEDTDPRPQAQSRHRPPNLCPPPSLAPKTTPADQAGIQLGPAWLEMLRPPNNLAPGPSRDTQAVDSMNIDAAGISAPSFSTATSSFTDSSRAASETIQPPHNLGAGPSQDTQAVDSMNIDSAGISVPLASTAIRPSADSFRAALETIEEDSDDEPLWGRRPNPVSTRLAPHMTQVFHITTDSSRAGKAAPKPIPPRRALQTPTLDHPPADDPRTLLHPGFLLRPVATHDPPHRRPGSRGAAATPAAAAEPNTVPRHPHLRAGQVLRGPRRQLLVPVATGHRQPLLHRRLQQVQELDHEQGVLLEAPVRGQEGGLAALWHAHERVADTGAFGLAW